MAWIEVHQSLPTHRKLVASSAHLRVSEPTLMGHLVCLWLWAVDNAPDGLLRADSLVLGKAAKWHRNAARFVEVLIADGWLDQTVAGLRLHHWEQYAGGLMAIHQFTAGQRRAGGLQRATTAARKAGRFAPEIHQVEPPGRPGEIHQVDLVESPGGTGAIHQVESPGRPGEITSYQTRPDQTQPDQGAAAPDARAREGFAAQFLDGWDANGFPPLSTAQLQAFRQWCLDFTGRWRKEPPKPLADHILNEAMDHSARSWAYVRAILDSCLTAGGVPPKPMPRPSQETNHGRRTDPVDGVPPKPWEADPVLQDLLASRKAHAAGTDTT